MEDEDSPGFSPISPTFSSITDEDTDEVEDITDVHVQTVTGDERNDVSVTDDSKELVLEEDEEKKGKHERGLELTARVEAKAPSQHNIPANSEWRFEVAFGTTVRVKLLSGTAELFGTELAPSLLYTFAPGTKAAIYTWHGCVLEVDGDCPVDYTSDETTMNESMSLSFGLEQIRQEAQQYHKDGPRLLLVGPENAGKTTLAKILTGYATKLDRQPLVVNLDPKEGLLSLPGSLTAAPFSTVIDIETGWGSSPTSGPSPVPVKLPLVYFYGLPDPTDDANKIFRPLISRIALAVTGRLDSDPATQLSGLIIDTPGSLAASKTGYDTIAHIVSEFSINVIVSLGSERLYSDMTKSFAGKATNNPHNPNETVAVLKIAKSGGAVDRDADYMKAVRQAQIREYFFGDPLGKTVLSPHTQTLDFSQIAIYKIVAGADTETDMLASLAPGGDDDEAAEAAKAAIAARQIFERVQPTVAMVGCILAITHADAEESEQESVRDASVMGFVYVVEVEEKRRRIKVLAPVGGRSMDGRAVVWGRWPEVVVDLVA